MDETETRKRQILAVLLVEYADAGVPIATIDGEHYALFETVTPPGARSRIAFNITTLTDQIVRNIR
jgi:hypothetical protein